MSGPKTVSYTLLKRQEDARQEDARRRAEEHKRREEFLKELKTANDRCDLLERRRARLEEGMEQLRAQFPAERLELQTKFERRPTGQDLASLNHYADKLEAQLKIALAEVAAAEKQATTNAEFKAALQSTATLIQSRTSTADAAIEAFLGARARSTADSLKRERLSTVRRILARVLKVKGLEVPPSLERLAADCIAATSPARFDAIASELRLGVQRLVETEHLRAAHKVEAAGLLEQLEDVPARLLGQLRQSLELVIAGALPLTPAIRTDVKDACEKATQTAAAEIVKGALQDLGYEVSGIQSTLFVEGGVAFFKKAEWDRYCVRLSTRPHEERMNFNVVRVASDQEGEAPQSDLEIETVWCSEYPKVMEALRARGLDAKLVRHLAAGALPVPRISERDVPAELVERINAKQRKGRGGAAAAPLANRPKR